MYLSFINTEKTQNPIINYWKIK